MYGYVCCVCVQLLNYCINALLDYMFIQIVEDYTTI